MNAPEVLAEVRTAFDVMGLRYGGIAAEQLLLGTAAKESGSFRHVRQKGGGPARGLWQMEPFTFHDLMDRVSAKNARALIILNHGNQPTVQALVTNHALAAAMARLKYRDDPNKLPAAWDIVGMAMLWKRHYNTFEGKGVASEFLAHWRKDIAPYEKEMWPNEQLVGT